LNNKKGMLLVTTPTTGVKYWLKDKKGNWKD